MTTQRENLARLAESYGVETTYHDDVGRIQEASVDALLAVMRVLGAPLKGPGDAATALRARKQAQWRWPLEPVHVVWDGHGGQAALRLAVRNEARTLGCHLRLESGEERSWSRTPSDLAVIDRVEVEGVAYQVRRLPLPEGLPAGYHRLTVQLPSGEAEGLVVSAPVRSYENATSKTWGVFLPLYAARSARNWGAGDFTDLENLIGWTQERGGGLVGTLPLLAAFLDEPFEPSPYSPASRLFWNELYLDVERVPELRTCPAAQTLLQSADFRRECTELRAAPLVDYRRLMPLKRRVLEELARSLFAKPSARLDELRRWSADHPRAEDYARFRATGERQRVSWWSWPERAREGDLKPGDYDEGASRYHLYVQWLADAQLRSLSAHARVRGPGLYLDLPLGVNGDGYDVWRERNLFALGASGGAPPDVFFTKGQDWGFPPLHPENLRQQGYHYLRECLHHHLQFAGMLRIDHVMGMHRLFFVPHGLGAKHGVYVRYPVEELYAVFSLESHRHKALLVGEDLGTVPEAVRPAMGRHNIRRLYVGQYEVKADGNRPFPPPAPGAVASLNTHDMPTFRAFWEALDVDDRVALGLLNEEAARDERTRRQWMRDSVLYYLRREKLLGASAEPTEVLRAWLALLGAGPVQAVLTNLEDLWGATEPQNVPGTWKERPNWRRKAQQPLETLGQLPGVTETLRTLDRAVRGQVR
jgi:4-alpha-glucanotransferase